MDLTDFDALSIDCYGALIDGEAGIAAVLGPWVRSNAPSITDEDLLVAFAAPALHWVSR